MQPQVIGCPRDDGRIADENDVRLWKTWFRAPAAPQASFTRVGFPCSMARSSVRSAHSAWMGPSHSAPKWLARRRAGPTRIRNSEHHARCRATSDWCSCLSRKYSTTCSRADCYAESIRRAYQAFFDSTIPADFVSLDDMAKSRIIYLPYPGDVEDLTVEQLKK